MISVLIIDDHFVARHGLKQTLREEFHELVFGEAATAADASFEVEKQPWDVIVLDISLPDKSGFHVLEEIRQKRPDARVLVLSVHAEPQYAVRALGAGAFAYVTKDSGRAELVTAFQSVLAGKKYVTPSLARRMGAHPKVQLNIGAEVLSARERAVLLRLAAGMRIGEIAAELKLNQKTVTTYRRRILDKLHLNSTADLVRYVIERELS